MLTIKQRSPRPFWRHAAVLTTLITAGCSNAPEGATEAMIANQAESLQRSADENTNRLIAQIEAQAAEDAAEAESANAAAPTNKADAVAQKK